MSVLTVQFEAGRSASSSLAPHEPFRTLRSLGEREGGLLPRRERAALVALVCVLLHSLPEGCPRPPTLRRPLPHCSCVPTPGRVAAYPGRHGRAVAARPALLLPPKVLVDGRLR